MAFQFMIPNQDKAIKAKYCVCVCAFFCMCFRCYVSMITQYSLSMFFSLCQQFLNMIILIPPFGYSEIGKSYPLHTHRTQTHTRMDTKVLVKIYF